MKEEELGPLFQAIIQGDADVAKKLITAHPDIVHESYLNLGSFLHIAANEGQTAISRFLIAAGADVNKATDTRLFRTPLCVAACEGHVELTALLLENGAFVDGIDATSHTPLMLAAREGHIEIVKMLLEAGVAGDANPRKNGALAQKYADDKKAPSRHRDGALCLATTIK